MCKIRSVLTQKETMKQKTRSTLFLKIYLPVIEVGVVVVLVVVIVVVVVVVVVVLVFIVVATKEKMVLFQYSL